MYDWFLIIPRLFGIAPWKIHEKYKQVRIAHGLFLVSAWIAVAGMLVSKSLAGIQHEYSEGSPGLKMMQLTVKLLCVSINAGAVARLFLLQHDKFSDMQQYFREVDSMFRGKIPKRRYDCTGPQAFIVFGVYVFMEYMELFVFEQGFEWSRLLDMLTHDNILLINALNWSILCNIQKRLEDLNFLVQSFSEDVKKDAIHYINVVAYDSGTMDKKKPKCDILQWNQLQLLINKIGALYNDLFGWHIFILMLYAMLQMLSLLKEFLDVGVRLNFNYLNLIAVTLYRIIEMVVLVSKCDAVSKESKRTTLLAYDASDHCVSTLNRKEIVRFAHQSGMQYIQFSAAGFFDIDNSVLFVMLQLVTTYVIVLVQFQHDDGSGQDSTTINTIRS